MAVKSAVGHVRERHWPFVLVLIAGTVAVYAPTVKNGFVNWDDEANLVENHHIKGLGIANLRWMATTTLLGVYEPLSWLAKAVQHRLWGMSPAAFHAVSVAIHSAATAVFYFLAVRLLSAARRGSPGPPVGTATSRVSAAAAALLFAVHPLRVESVSWATAQPYLLCGFFALTATLAHVLWTEQGRRRWRRLSVVAYLLALLCKSIAIPLAAALLVLDVYPLRRLSNGRPGWRGLLWEKWPHFALAVIFSVAALYASRSNASRAAEMEWSARLAVAGYGTWYYVGKSVLPLSLAIYHPLPAPTTLREPGYLLCMMGTVLVSAALVVFRRHFPAGLAVWLFYGIMLAPVAGLVQHGAQLVADRYTYLSCLGGALLAGGALHAVRSRRSLRVGVVTLLTVAVAALAVRTRSQIGVWHDSASLWAHNLSIYPDDPMGKLNLGIALSERGQYERAAAQYRAALDADADSDLARYNLGLLAYLDGRFDEALAHLRDAQRRNPALWEAHHYEGRALASLGRNSEALEAYRRAVRLHPDAVDVRCDMGHGLMMLGRFDEALASYDEALRRDPRSVAAHLGRGRVYARWRRFDEALSDYRIVLEIDPASVEGHYQAGLVLSRSGRFTEATAHFESAMTIDPQDWRAHAKLAAVHALAGQKDQALAVFRNALRAGPGSAGAEFYRVNFVPGICTVGGALWKRGARDAAVEVYASALAKVFRDDIWRDGSGALRPSPVYARPDFENPAECLFLAGLYAHFGDDGRAADFCDRVRASLPRTGASADLEPLRRVVNEAIDCGG